MVIRSVEGDRDLSDSDEFANARYRMYSQPTSRTGSVRIPSDGQQQQKQHQPPPPPGPTVMVRRVGSRQMLVLGDEASIHGQSFNSENARNIYQKVGRFI